MGLSSSVGPCPRSRLPFATEAIQRHGDTEDTEKLTGFLRVSVVGVIHFPGVVDRWTLYRRRRGGISTGSSHCHGKSTGVILSGCRRFAGRPAGCSAVDITLCFSPVLTFSSSPFKTSARPAACVPGSI